MTGGGVGFLAAKFAKLGRAGGCAEDGNDGIDNNLWWNRDDLIVSVRYDTDGIAATRSPNDLVGRGTWKQKQQQQQQASFVEITMSGRGAFGKFATGGSKR